MKTSIAAFRFSLVGFTLPFMFVYRPALCLLAPEGTELTWIAIVHAILAAVIGILALASALAGYARHPLSWLPRLFLFVSAGLLLAPLSNVGGNEVGVAVDVVGGGIFAAVFFYSYLRSRLEQDEIQAAVNT